MSAVVTRKDLKNFRRVLIKVGTSVVIHGEGSVALGRIGFLVEQIAHIMKGGNREVIVVTSGAVGMGKIKIGQNALLSMPLRTHVLGNTTTGFLEDPRAAAAAGQRENLTSIEENSLMALYELLFAQKQISCAQVLLTDEDFSDDERRGNLGRTLDNLLRLGILPILNENDVISTRKKPIRDEKGAIFWDNDSLSTLIAAAMGVDLVIILSDVEGLCRSPPDPSSDQKPAVIHTYFPDQNNFIIGQKSRVGRGGMQAKVEACMEAIRGGVKAVVIASGYVDNVVKKIIEGERVGTIFVAQPSALTSGSDEQAFYIHMTHASREASRFLQQLTGAERGQLIASIADKLVENTKAILAENAKDLENSRSGTISESLRARLILSTSKIETLAKGLKSVAAAPDPIGQVISQTELAPGLILSKETVPMGVLLVIFESRPDVLPQVAALALKSGNALILKGGKEASFTNAILHKIIATTVEEKTQSRVPRNVVTLLESREAVASLLKQSLTDGVDLVIPRGSSQLVKDIQDKSRVPVLGHSEGICHVFVHKDASLEKALAIVLDAKTDYPAACNSVECVLVHSELPDSFITRILEALAAAKVTVYAGPKARLRVKTFGVELPPAKSLSHEYSDLSLTLEIVDSLPEAVRFINKHGSSHTDAIVTEDKDAAETFLSHVDSACVFHNASTRFADGYRFGLGAEVGISTSRIHARGPVGVEGLLTTRFHLRSSNYDTVSNFTKGIRSYTHKALPLPSKL